MKKLSIFLIIILFITPLLFAKRAAPKEVKSVIYEGIEYKAPHSKMGYVEAWDAKTNEKIWEERIYEVWINPFMEADVQHIFITELKIANGKLIISNEKSQNYSLDLETRKVKKINP